MKGKFAPMLNIYPDSLGGRLRGFVDLLENEGFRSAFRAVYILPSIFHSDLDRGFSVIDYGLNRMLADEEDLGAIGAKGLELKLDLILNHASVLSPQFQDLLQKGEDSVFKDFFINWNKFWQGHGAMTDAGHILPNSIDKMFFRKPGLPILNVELPNGTSVPYWNTFYQEIVYKEIYATELMELGLQYPSAEILAERINAELASGQQATIAKIESAIGDLAQASTKTTAESFQHRHLQKIFSEKKDAILGLVASKKTYLGQMDLNINSELVWKFYDETLATLSDYGARIIRLDAFAYASKKPGSHNFFNEPETWEILNRIREIASKYELELLPEIHASYESKIYESISKAGYWNYDFFLPGLILDALERQSAEHLLRWGQEIVTKQFALVNMLGCHDGIPLLDLRGLLAEQDIQNLIAVLKSRGGLVKDLHGKKNMYYQVNCSYYSALGENDKRFLLARAIQLFMPAKPQIWYLDLFAGKNDYEAIRGAGSSGHKEINRSNLSTSQIQEGLSKNIVQDQLELIAFRNSFPAFDIETFTPENCSFTSNRPSELSILWQNAGYSAQLDIDLAEYSFTINRS